jgi:hypothetical protein
MSRVLTGDKMIESVRKRTMTPDDTSIFTDQDILDILNEEMDVQILDKLLALHEEHLTVHIDIPRNAEGIYDIPYRAIGNKLRDVSLVNGTNVVYELSQISLGELPDYSYSIDSNTYLDRFYVESNQIKLVAPTRNYDYLRIYFYIRPNVLTKTKEAAVITDWNIDENEDTIRFNFSTAGKNFSSKKEYDIIGYKTPNKIKGFDLAPEEVDLSSTPSVTFKWSDIQPFFDEIKVGDYLSIAEQTPVPNIPTEMHPVLAQGAAIHILESLGDTEALGNAQRRMEKMVAATQSLVDDRVELAPKKIKPRHSTLGQSLGISRKYRGKY